MKTIPYLAFVTFLVGGFSDAWSADRAPADAPQRISFGEEIKLEDHLIPGKTVIFDFTSPFCGPCRLIAPLLERYDRDHDDVVVVAVDINRPNLRDIDWQSPVARQYGIRYVPQFKVFGPDGHLIAEGAAADTLVLKWLNFSWPED